MESLIAALPKAELHVHLEGSLSPALLFALARKHGHTGVPDSVEAVERWYEFRDFPHFIEIYRTAGEVLVDEEDFAALAEDVVRTLAAQNVRYAELSLSLSDHLVRGIAPEVVFAGVEAGRARVPGIEVRWIPDFAGDRGADLGERTLDAVLEHGPSSVVGFGVGGIEVDREPFAAVFGRARAAGLHSVPHAGENQGPGRVWSALRALGAERIGHGIDSLQDPALMAELRDRRIPVDVSPTSNVRTRAVAAIGEHPLPVMLDAGLLVTLNSDDPTMFGTTLTDEYRAAAGLGVDVVTLARHGFEASFASPELKAEALAEIDELT
ncbi:adenosine deaminase [Pseudonocardia xishanensis]|uniref:Adenosine deaminase n=1 Tax=Pseudonocardia xishanensis TaxID=630995 RepID=A0ABP8RNQ0_9PSEU